MRSSTLRDTPASTGPRTDSGMNAAPIQFPNALYWQARLFSATQGMWRRLADIESGIVREEIEAVAIHNPIFITSLARAGTTILTEMLEQHPDATSHHYSDFPNVWTPYWRNYILQRSRRTAPPLEERAHRDRVMVSADSPEAVEELLWMHFFPLCHAHGQDNRLDAEHARPEFDDFYRDHIRKLLCVRSARRYLAKGNYNVLRLAYLKHLFPDFRVLVPYRDPVDHIASLAKQHQFFLEQHRLNPRIGHMLSLNGHFEFGPHRRALCFGDQAEWQSTQDAWNTGREVEGWARYWSACYRHLLEQTHDDQTLAAACRFISYERLCEQSGDVIDEILSHCVLDATAFKDQRSRYSHILSRPDYYAPEFTAAERETIRSLCDPVKAALDERSRAT